MSTSDEDSDLGSTLSEEECTPHDDEKQRNRNSDFARRAAAPRLSLKRLPKTLPRKKENPGKLTNEQIEEHCKKQMAVFKQHENTHLFVIAFLAVHNRKIQTHWEKT